MPTCQCDMTSNFSYYLITIFFNPDQISILGIRQIEFLVYLFQDPTLTDQFPGNQSIIQIIDRIQVLLGHFIPTYHNLDWILQDLKNDFYVNFTTWLQRYQVLFKQYFSCSLTKFIRSRH